MKISTNLSFFADPDDFDRDLDWDLDDDLDFELLDLELDLDLEEWLRDFDTEVLERDLLYPRERDLDLILCGRGLDHIFLGGPLSYLPRSLWGPLYELGCQSKVLRLLSHDRDQDLERDLDLDKRRLPRPSLLRLLLLPDRE